ncbi:MAG: carbon-nitrogen hydrolase family protein [Methylophilaceae bacterium]|jgi:nitrilase|nr:carbon-nitrogen hydrolase family protein [Methylophilaceae bacterium]
MAIKLSEKKLSAKKSDAPKPTSAGNGVVKIAGIQMASGPNVAANLSEAEKLIEIAVEQGAKLVALPEYFAIMGMKDTDKVKVAEKEGSGPIQEFLSNIAKKHEIWVVGGSIPLQSEQQEKIYNACMVYNDQGQLVARYNKIHLFGLNLGNETYHEEKTITPGKQVVTVDSPFGKIGLSICYDLRFPELYRAMGEVDLILIPAAFTETTGKAHWESLVRSRAIENLCYVLAPAQGGYHTSGRETHGNSMVVDPWGVVLDRLPRGSGVVIASMNRDYQSSLRKSLPALQNKTIFK